MVEYGTFSTFGKLRRVLMHRPFKEFDLMPDSPNHWGFVKKPNKEKAAAEFDSFIAILEDTSVKVEHIVISEDVPTPTLQYTHDLGVVTTDGIITSNFRYSYRQGEQLFLEIMADRLNIPIFGRIRNAFFEAGDFERISDNVSALGINRTSYMGYEEFSEFVNETVLPIPYHSTYPHLDSLFSMVTESMCVACVESLPAEFINFLALNDIGIIEVSLSQQKLMGANILMLEGNKIIIADDVKIVASNLEREGVDVIPVKFNELRKGGGGPGSITLSLLRK